MGVEDLLRGLTSRRNGDRVAVILRARQEAFNQRGEDSALG
jgi:hypothetical protein